MSDTQQIEGRCLCGAVGVKAEAKPSIGACHCQMCRQWTSSPLQTVDCGSEISLSGTEHIGVYASSDWAERAFCQRCGSALYYRFKATNQYFVAAGLFGDLPGFAFDHEVFIDQKPEFYTFEGERMQLTAAQVMAEFGAAPD